MKYNSDRLSEIDKLCNQIQLRTGTVESYVVRLEDAIRLLLSSADASWERDDLGHDWGEACKVARYVLNSDNRDTQT